MLRGIVLSLSASTLFGYMYYFSTLLMPLRGEDILGFRIIFTAPFVISAVILFKQKRMVIGHFRRIAQKPWLILVFMLNATISGVQMWLFLWAPNNGSALSVSIGYLLLPLVMVIVGRFLFKEYISRIKLSAILCAAVGVLINILLKGGISWELLVVCTGYSTYFAIRKSLGLMDLASFCIEICLMLPVCLYFAAQVDLSVIKQANPDIVFRLMLLGLISGVALSTYVAASNRLPINVLGLLGYVEPCVMLTMAFLLGESLDPESYPLFMCLLIAMILLIADGMYALRHKKKTA